MEREEVIRNLRACLLSIKGALKVENLSHDYRTLVSENIPYRKLGFSTLDAFLRTVPGLRIFGRGDQCFVEAVPTQETAHLTKLVAQQKQSSKKSRNRPRSFAYGSPRRPVSYRVQRPPRPVVYYPPSNVNVIQPQRHQYQPPQQQNYQKPQHIYQPAQQHQFQQPAPKPLLQYQPPPQPLPQRQPVAQPAQNTTKIDRDPRNGLKAATSPPGFQVISPLSPARLLSRTAPSSQPKSSPPALLSINLEGYPNSRLSTTTDVRLELLARAKLLNLPDPVYKILPTQIKNTKQPSVFAQVKIGPHGYGSYPKEAQTEDEAQRIAAEVALLDLTEKYGVPINDVKTIDKNVILDRVLAIINSHPNGVFLHQVPILYKQQYKEVLSPNWELVVESCPSIVLENGVDNSIILRRYTSPTTPVNEAVSPNRPRLRLNSLGPVTPGQLELPEGELWIVHVTSVMDTKRVWVRLGEDRYSEKFQELSDEMIQHYSNVQNPIKPSDIEIGNYYTVFEDNSWHRVRCMEYDRVLELAAVLFIDVGEEDYFPISKIYALEKQFCVLPAQAFKVTLAGLEEFSECDSIITEIEKRLLYRPFYVDVVNRGVREDGPHATIVFYDTEGPEDVNLNSVFLKQILTNILAVPKLDADRQVSEVFLSHIEQNGDIYVQIQSESMKYLMQILNKLIERELDPDHLTDYAVISIDLCKIYFVLFDGNWYRGKVTEQKCTQVKVFLIDFGKTVTVGSRNLLLLEKLSEILAAYPAQALKVHLHNIDNSMFNEKMAARLCELAPAHEPLLAKVVKSSTENVPVVELLKRIQPNNLLVSINNTLVYEDEINTRMQGDGNNNVKPRRRLDRTNSKPNEDDDSFRSLKPPKISIDSEFFDVHVTMAAHPGNFIVQPFADRENLQNMMHELQKECSAYRGPAPLPNTVTIGKLFAAQHRDGHWYRVCVSSNIIRENMVSVYYCDFGDVSVLPLSKLQPLKSQFFELPYQAIKAKLVGIQPLNVDWSVEDSLRFQELVVEKDFVSMVVETVSSEVSPADTILGLKLINVDTSEDIYIDKLLVEEGRAVLIDT